MKIAGFEIIRFAEVGSTNDVAADYSHEPGKKLVVQAQRQTAGRGRRGRLWQSLDGNLFFSMLLEFPLSDLGKLVLCASLSLLETVKMYDKTVQVALKWPNDVLINDAKLSGMLLEKGNGNYIIVGIGVNVVQSPKTADMLYPTISLKEAGITTTADEFLEHYY